MRMFVAGGTGYLGSALVVAARAAGHAVTVLARSDAAAERARALGAAALPGDLTRPASVAGAGEDHDVLVHVASMIGPDRVAEDRAATATLIDSARRAAAPRLVVYTSGIWALGPYRGRPDDETTPAEDPAAKSAYRVELERDILAAAGGALRTAVVRPGMVYGGKEGALAWLLDWLPRESGRPHAVVMFGDGENRWPVVHRDDLAGLVLRLGAHPSAAGVFHAVEPEPVRVRELAERLGALAGRPVEGWAIDDATARMGAIVEAAARDQHVLAPRSAAVLDWRPMRPRLMDAVPALYRELIG